MRRRSKERWREEIKKEWTKEELWKLQWRVRKERLKEYKSERAYRTEVKEWVDRGGVD